MSRSRKITHQDANLERIWTHFDPEVLQAICEMPERDFIEAYDMTGVHVPQSEPNDFYAFRDNGSDVLAVAHLDTVAKVHDRRCNFLNTAGGPVVYSRALDDRLGAYVILELLPKLDITCDLLLTVGEEECKSTAYFFEPPKEYDWVIEFDRGGTDVVMYQYDDHDTQALVEQAGARVGEGSFSDICFLEHLGVKAFNWGVGYQDYHSARSHAFLADTFIMVSRFMDFHAANEGVYMPHVQSIPDDDDFDAIQAEIDADEAEYRAWLADVNS